MRVNKKCSCKEREAQIFNLKQQNWDFINEVSRKNDISRCGDYVCGARWMEGGDIFLSLKITVCCLALDSRRETQIYGFRWLMDKQIECLNILSRISGINFNDCPHDVDSLELSWWCYSCEHPLDRQLSAIRKALERKSLIDAWQM